VNAWIGGLFAPDRREDTVGRLLDADLWVPETLHTSCDLLILTE
jgi:hypothetical protein